MSIRYTIRHNIPAEKLAAEDVNDSSTWDLDLLRKHELAETNNHDVVYRQHDGKVVSWAEAATQQSQAILEEVQGISANIDEQVQAVEAQLEDVTAAAEVLTQEAEEANEAAQQAVLQAQTAVESASSSEASALESSNTAYDWAVKMNGKVDDLDYSSKYYAIQAATSESNASTSETNAQSYASTAVSAKNDAVSAKSTAQTAATSASASATIATTKAGEASDSATTASTKASEASTSATNAATSATSAASNATSAAASASSAGMSATAAATSATSAATSATNAATSETNAATSETNASDSEAIASAAKIAAEAALAQIQRMKNYYGLPIGYEFFTFNPNLPEGTLPLLGGEYLRESYETLWAWVQTQTGYLKTEAEWQDLSTAQNGNVPYYSDGDGSTTFRVPSLQCLVSGQDNSIQLIGDYSSQNLQSGSSILLEKIIGLWVVKAYGTIVETGSIDEQAYLDEQMRREVLRTEQTYTKPSDFGSAAFTDSTDYLGVSATAADSSKLGGTAASGYAKLASPTFTGTPSSTTAAVATNTTQIATTAYVKGCVPASIGSGVKPVYTNSSGVVTASGNTVGSATQGIYLNAGTITKCTYTVSKSVPSNAVFTDTNNISASSVAANGYIKFNNGLIIQWGKYTEPADGATLSFPISFASAVYSMSAVGADKTPADGYGWAKASSVSKFTCGLGNDLGTNSSKIYIIAIGK